MAELWFVDALLETLAFARDRTTMVAPWLCPLMELNPSCRVMGAYGWSHIYPFATPDPVDVRTVNEIFLSFSREDFDIRLPGYLAIMPNDCIMETRRRRTGDALGRAKHDGVTGWEEGYHWVFALQD
jgi:hypothetical protein